MFKMEEIKMGKLEGFYKKYEYIFDEYLDKTEEKLIKKNEEYAKLNDEFNKILDKNENITYILEGQTMNRKLSNNECYLLGKLAKIYCNMQAIKEQEIFFLGAKENYIYLKNLELIKD